MFGNSERQEVVLEAGQDAYRLKFTIDTSIELETRLKKPTGQILQEMGTFSVTTLRDVLHGCLQEYHGKEFPLSDGGRKKVQAVMKKVTTKKLVAALTEIISLDEKDGEANPPEAQDESEDEAGGNSSLKLVESA